jgi:ribosomal protein S27AE
MSDETLTEEGKKNVIVTLRRETFDDAVGLLKLVSELHECDGYTGKCYETCLACEAQRIVKAMKKEIEVIEQAPPNCKVCGDNTSMVKHDDGEWYCHRTHRINTKRTKYGNV